MKNYIVNNFKAINYQYAVGQSLPTWGDLEGWSTGMVTDKDAYIQQGFLYALFGEIIAEYGWQSSNVPKYAFNAKELDEENNMYYYSARYYAPPTFISRDPMFEKYPSISPYTYCGNNPVMYIDPTGLFRKESKANKARIYAMEKMKNCTVGEVYQTEKGRYEFIITKNDKYKSLNDGNVSSEGGTLNTLIVYGDKGKRIRSNIGLLFYSKFGINFDGIFGTSDKGQGKETKRGDGETINLDQFTDPVPKPIINENGTTTPPSNENKEESKNYEGTKGHFDVIHDDANWGKSKHNMEYDGSEDSLRVLDIIKDDTNKTIEGVIVY